MPEVEKKRGSSLTTEGGKNIVMKEVEKAEAAAVAAVAAVAVAAVAAVAAAVAAAAAVALQDTVEEVKDAKDRIRMQQRVCYACGALLRRERTGTCGRTGIGQAA